MKKRAILGLLVIIAAGICFAADPAEGFWISIDDKTDEITAGWEFYQENGKLCGKMLSVVGKTPDTIASKCRDSYKNFPVSGRVNTMPVIGTPWIFNLSMEKEGQWRGGNIIHPDNGGIYNCNVTFYPQGSRKNSRVFQVDTVEMQVTFGLIRVNQYWQKATQAQAASVR